MTTSVYHDGERAVQHSAIAVGIDDRNGVVIADTIRTGRARGLSELPQNTDPGRMIGPWEPGCKLHACGPSALLSPTSAGAANAATAMLAWCRASRRTAMSA